MKGAAGKKRTPVRCPLEERVRIPWCGKHRLGPGDLTCGEWACGTSVRGGTRWLNGCKGHPVSIRRVEEKGASVELMTDLFPERS